MRKRNYENEILNIKERSNHFTQLNLYRKISEIGMTLDNIKNSKNKIAPELLRYIPITLVACFQSYLRELIIELIDFGEPYTENVKKINQVQNIKFDFSILNAINKKKFTLGEFIAHLIPCNNINDFNKNLSLLTNSDFLFELKEFNYSENTKLNNESNKFFKNNFGNVLTSIERTFELRNIYCHEFAFEINLTLEDTEKMLEDCTIFLFQVYLYKSHLFNFENKKNLESVEEIKKKSKTEYSELKAELRILIETIIKNHKNSNSEKFFNESLFRKSILKWNEYVSAKIGAKFGVFEGTNLDFINLGFLIKETKEKIEELKETYEDVLIINKDIKLDENDFNHKFIKKIISNILSE